MRETRKPAPPRRRLPWLRSISFYANGSFIMPRDRENSRKRDETIPRKCLLGFSSRRRSKPRD